MHVWVVSGFVQCPRICTLYTIGISVPVVYAKRFLTRSLKHGRMHEIEPQTQ